MITTCRMCNNAFVEYTKIQPFNGITPHQNNYFKIYRNTLTTVHAMRKPFVPFCSAQDAESADINCLVF